MSQSPVSRYSAQIQHRYKPRPPISTQEPLLQASYTHSPLPRPPSTPNRPVSPCFLTYFATQSASSDSLRGPARVRLLALTRARSRFFPLNFSRGVEDPNHGKPARGGGFQRDCGGTSRRSLLAVARGFACAETRTQEAGDTLSTPQPQPRAGRSSPERTRSSPRARVGKAALRLRVVGVLYATLDRDGGVRRAMLTYR